MQHCGGPCFIIWRCFTLIEPNYQSLPLLLTSLNTVIRFQLIAHWNTGKFLLKEEKYVLYVHRNTMSWSHNWVTVKSPLIKQLKMSNNFNKLFCVWICVRYCVGGVCHKDPTQGIIKCTCWSGSAQTCCLPAVNCTSNNWLIIQDEELFCILLRSEAKCHSYTHTIQRFMWYSTNYGSCATKHIAIILHLIQ